MVSHIFEATLEFYIYYFLEKKSVRNHKNNQVLLFQKAGQHPYGNSKFNCSMTRKFLFLPLK